MTERGDRARVPHRPLLTDPALEGTIGGPWRRAFCDTRLMASATSRSPNRARAGISTVIR
jgi:hypothetical protein